MHSSFLFNKLEKNAVLAKKNEEFLDSYPRSCIIFAENFLNKLKNMNYERKNEIQNW